MQDKIKDPIKIDKKQTFSLILTIITVCLILVAGGIMLPYLVSHHKQNSLDTHFYLNRITNLAQVTEKYKTFWHRYDIILTQRANTDGNPAISLQEKATFDEGFFGTLGLTVDQTTKTITKNDGSYPNETALICRINYYYPSHPWIHPICPDL
jgi:hypothetical protein